MDLAGQAVIITGSSSGISAAIARPPASPRGRDHRQLGILGASRPAHRRRTAHAVYLQGDIGDPGTAAALVSAAESRWGRLDGPVNNAGVTVDVPLTTRCAIGQTLLVDCGLALMI